MKTGHRIRIADYYFIGPFHAQDKSTRRSCDVYSHAMFGYNVNSPALER